MSPATKVRINPMLSGARNAPFLNLEDAVERAKILHQKSRRTPMLAPTAASYLGFSPKSSTVSLIIASLKKYGLIHAEDTPQGNRVHISDLGYKIIVDARENSPDRRKRIRQAALLPKAHRELWQRFGAELPDDESIRTHLMIEEGYSEDAARNLARVYRETIAFAGLDQSGILGDVAADEADPESALAGTPTGTRSSSMDQRDRQGNWESTSAESSSPLRVLSIPLKSSDAITFDIRFPRTLSAEDFEFVKSTLDLWKDRLVAAEPAATAEPTKSR